MKKTLCVLLCALLVLVSCRKNSAVYVDADPSAVIDSVYGALEDGSAASEYVPQLITEQITEKNEEYYLGVAGVPYASGAASEAFVQPVTYSFCVIRLEEGADYDAERKKIERNINKSKWVCAAAEDATVVRYENVIAVIMGEKQVCRELEGAFLKIIASK